MAALEQSIDSVLDAVTANMRKTLEINKATAHVTLIHAAQCPSFPAARSRVAALMAGLNEEFRRDKIMATNDATELYGLMTSALASLALATSFAAVAGSAAEGHLVTGSRDHELANIDLNDIFAKAGMHVGGR